MRQNWPKAYSYVIKSEGGYVNDPHDHGGETNLGVTRAAWGEYLGRPVRDGEMKALTVARVEPFYKARYWDKVAGDELPTGLDYAVYDFAVNAGPDRAVRYLQRAVGGLEVDGRLGPKTLAAVKAADVTKTLAAYSELRADFYHALASRDETQGRFLKGWMNRVAEVQRNATTLLA